MGQLYFCGEHTSEDFQGYMEGAAESGERAASEVLAALGGNVFLGGRGSAPLLAGESEAYSQARKKLLAEEIEFRRHMTRLAEQRRALPPGPVIRTDYRFKLADGSEVGLRDLFGKHDTLVSCNVLSSKATAPTCSAQAGST